MKILKRILSIIIWTFIALYLLLMTVTHIPAVQQYIGRQSASLLADKLGTEVKVGRVDLGFLNRLVIDDVRMQDQQGKEMLRIGRLAVRISATLTSNLHSTHWHRRTPRARHRLTCTSIRSSCVIPVSSSISYGYRRHRSS